jgi:hypothetical protein
MDIDTARAKEIDIWIQDHPTLKVQELKAPIELLGSTSYYDVWRIPIRLLIYNVRNGRFAAELMARENELKRSLDPTIPEDSKEIQKLLLEQNEQETIELKASLRENGQLEEGIITFDGAVINANRRMAVLSQLYEETSDPKYEFLKVARLPKNVDEKDVWRIEAGLQFAKDLRLEYGPVNELLKLREGKKRGLTSKQISHALQGRYTPEDVEKRLKVLDLIDSYLEYIGRPKEYRLFQEARNVEKFNSLSNNVIEPLKKREEIPKTEIPQIVSAGFSLIKSDEVTHWEIRKLRGIAQNKTAKATLLNDFHPGNLKEPSLKRLVENFSLAEDVFDSAQEHDKPKQLLERALVILESIDRNSSRVKDPEVQGLLEKISRVVEQLKHQ